MAFTGRELRSTVTGDGKLTLSLEDVEITDPADDEIIVRIEAAPINPSDLGLLIGPADLSTLRQVEGMRPGLTFAVPPARLKALAGRLDQSLPVGNEGAGTVVAAGRNAEALIGQRVGMFAGGMYADYRKVPAQNATPLPGGATAAQGASMFVNPLTALGFVETARREGHKAIIHTAGASNLGQMVQRICLADGIALINIVRSPAQVDLLRGVGAKIVLNSKDEDFHEQLVSAIAETGATIAFDPIGGGTLGSDVLQAMEEAAVRRMSDYSRYGSDTFKQLYIYGTLDFGPTILNRRPIGYQWSVSGWLLTPFLKKAGLQVEQRLRQRVIDELTTTFASTYTKVIGLAEALQPDILRAYERKATGEKFLIDPTRG
ncbi:zinc-binding dehydrogenase [Niveispirillum sp.]|uniref:zinc-binding dehydrogenase n=1 Tax=Niveispirillum sp. TaxID=1917217 RepID=UPI001B433CA0|nr:zinc-binding dehydrogenase [Niveispirillum sp.]MBP7335704.1 zinc-binding dehydrogenase [Niveispirillum sp.]